MTPFITYFYDYTDSKFYEKAAEQLKAQITSLGGKLLVFNPILNDNYNINCLQKPRFILNKLIELKHDFIWIDADCYINKLPTELDNIKEDIGLIRRTQNLETPHSAVIYFKYNNKTLSFVEEWAEKCEKEIPNVKLGLYDGGDHCKLIETFNNRKDLSYGFFDPSVCSSTHKESNILIGISPGGWGVEKRKNT
jgi:hypothetical protein